MVSSQPGLQDLKDSGLPPLEDFGGGGGSGLDLEPSLLEAIGLDKSQLNLSGAIHTSEPDLGDLSLGEGGVAEHTELKLHERGWVQFGVMGAAVGVATIFAGTFLSQSFGLGKQNEQGAKGASQVDVKTGAEERGFVSPEESKDAELSRLRAERAIVDQQYQSRLLEIQRQQQLSAQVNANSGADSKADQSSSSPSTVTAVVPPPPVVEVPPPAVTAPMTIVPEAPDLRQQWQTAQELWTLQQQFGSFSGKAVGNPLRTELSARPDVPSQSFSSNPESSSQPTWESTAPVPGSGAPSVPSTGSSQNVALLEEQQAFLAGKIYGSDSLAEGPVQVASAKINAGTQIGGVIKTPIIFIEGDQEAGNRSFTIELTEGLDLGAMKIPAGSALLAEVSTVAANGVMFLTGSVLVTPEGEVELPEGIVEIRGHQGKPLIANLINRGQAAEIAKGLGAMAVGGVREAANLYNRPDQQTIITENQTIVTNRQPEKNYPAAAIGGALTEITPRVQDALRPAGRNPARVWQIPAGRRVSIFFRRSLTMEIAQS